MITEMNYYTITEKGEEIHVLEFPELDSININDPDIQKEAIRWGLAADNSNGNIIFEKNARLVATGSQEAAK